MPDLGTYEILRKFEYLTSSSTLEAATNVEVDHYRIVARTLWRLFANIEHEESASKPFTFLLGQMIPKNNLDHLSFALPFLPL